MALLWTAEGDSPVVKFVVEFKGPHKLDSENRIPSFWRESGRRILPSTRM